MATSSANSAPLERESNPSIQSGNLTPPSSGETAAGRDVMTRLGDVRRARRELMRLDSTLAMIERALISERDEEPRSAKRRLPFNAQSPLIGHSSTGRSSSVLSPLLSTGSSPMYPIIDLTTEEFELANEEPAWYAELEEKDNGDAPLDQWPFEADPDYNGPVSSSLPCRKNGVLYIPDGWRLK